MPKRRLFDRPMMRVLATLVVALVLYYALPIGMVASSVNIAFAVCLLVASIVMLAWLISRQVVRQIKAPEDQGVQFESLLTLLLLVIFVFSIGYFVLGKFDTGQFNELHTKTDALYFTVTTLATVGYGDVNARGQLARAIVTLQMAFDLVFVGALVGTMRGRFKSVDPKVLGRGRTSD